jgi:tripartite-type tricarboxylate transporter receptor subunit TctC
MEMLQAKWPICCLPAKVSMVAVVAVVAVVATVLGTSASSIHAQGYPIKPVRLVVGNAPGGSDDSHGRLVGQKLTEMLGQQFIVDNRGGSGGTIARMVVAKSAADGYTLILGGASMASAVHMVAKPIGDPTRDFAPISLIAKTHSVLVVHPSMPAKTVKDLIALAPNSGNRLNFGSTGVGAGPHLNVELFLSMAKIEATHIPYKGAGAGLYVDMISGQLDFYFGPIITALPFIASGKVRALAVSGVNRAPKLPQVPTMAEAALPGYEMSGWYGLFAPAATPQEIIAVLNGALVKQLASPTLREALIMVNSEPRSSTPGELAQHLADDIEHYRRLIKPAGIQPQ